jgi:hypothetical protein
MATTTNYGWTTPDDTALVKDGASAIRTLGSSVDTTTKNLNPSTTLGDIEYRSSTANTNTRLGIGSTGDVLTVAGGVPSWAAPAGGALTLISTTAMTSGSAITLSSIPTTYNSLYFTITSWRASAGASIRLTFNGAASANDYADVPADQSDLNFGASFLQLTAGQNNANTNSFVRGNLPNYSDTTSWKILESTAISNDDATPTRVRAYFGKVGATDQTAAITSLVFTLNTGTFAAGTLNLYGVK